MAGVVSTLKTYNDVGTLRQPIDDLPFALVAPLRTDDHDVCHFDVPLIVILRQCDGPTVDQ